MASALDEFVDDTRRHRAMVLPSLAIAACLWLMPPASQSAASGYRPTSFDRLPYLAHVSGQAAADDRWEKCAPPENPDTRIEACTALIEEIDPTLEGLAIAYFERGTAFAAKENHKAAIDDFTNAIRLDPDNPDYFHSRSAAFFFSGDHRSALADLDQVLLLAPDHPDAMFWRGKINSILGNDVEAIAAFREASRHGFGVAVSTGRQSTGDGSLVSLAGSAGRGGFLSPEPKTGQGLEVCNATPSDAFVALGFRDEQRWQSRGWWRVSANTCASVVGGPLRSRFYYLYSVDSEGAVGWDGKAPMCAGEASFFSTGLDDCHAQGLHNVDFFEVDTGEYGGYAVLLEGPAGPAAPPPVSPPPASGEARYEFLFTPTDAVWLDTGARVSVGDTIELDILRRLLPGYEFEEAEDEGHPVLYVFARRNDEGFGLGGINLFYGYEQDGTIDFITGSEGVVDGAGVTAGTPLVDAYTTDRAKCGGEFDYACQAERVPNLFYTLDLDACGNDIEVNQFGVDGKLTDLHPCMKVYALILLKPGESWW